MTKVQSRRRGSKSVSIYKFQSVMVVQPKSVGKRGLLVGVAPCKCLPTDSDPSDVVAVIRELLPLSSDVWPPPPGLKEEPSALLRAAKIRTWKEYDPIALVDVELEDSGRYELIPMVREGGNHVPIGARSIKVKPDADEEELVRAVDRAIKRSESGYRPKRTRKKK